MILIYAEHHAYTRVTLKAQYVLECKTNARLIIMSYFCSLSVDRCKRIMYTTYDKKRLRIYGKP